MKMALCFAFAFVAAATCAMAQDHGNVDDAAPVPVRTSRLEFSKPETIANIGADATYLDNFRCADDGSAYIFVNGNVSGTNADPDRQNLPPLLGVHPDSTVTSFPWWSVPQFSWMSLPQSVFVGNGHVYVLDRGRRISKEQERTPVSPVVLKYDMAGHLQETISPAEDRNAFVLGVFPSGHMLLIAEDRLNHRMSLDLLDEHGVFIRVLRLNKDDFVERAAQLPTASRGTGSYSTNSLISSSELVPWNGHLVLVPLYSSGLPIIELSEDGVVSSITPHLPEGTVIESLISVGASTVTIQPGKVLQSGNPTVDPQGKFMGVPTQPFPRITLISRANGGIVKELDLGSADVEPECESAGVYQFLTSDHEGMLQLVSARAQ
ncbi:MAG TPA: hypothetical protein VGJ21_10970 [Terracidiphilus sp.]|jgi:hypothetical protein